MASLRKMIPHSVPNTDSSDMIREACEGCDIFLADHLQQKRKHGAEQGNIKQRKNRILCSTEAGNVSKQQRDGQRQNGSRGGLGDGKKYRVALLGKNINCNDLYGKAQTAEKGKKIAGVHSESRFSAKADQRLQCRETRR